MGFAFVMVFPFSCWPTSVPQGRRLLFPFRRNLPFGGDNGVRSPAAGEPGWPVRKGAERKRVTAGVLRAESRRSAGTPASRGMTARWREPLMAATGAKTVRPTKGKADRSGPAANTSRHNGRAARPKRSGRRNDATKPIMEARPRQPRGRALLPCPRPTPCSLLRGCWRQKRPGGWAFGAGRTPSAGERSEGVGAILVQSERRANREVRERRGGAGFSCVLTHCAIGTCELEQKNPGEKCLDFPPLTGMIG